MAEQTKNIAPGPDYGPVGSGATNEVRNLTQADIDRIIQIAQVSNEEFTHRTRKGSDLQPLGVEQICWALTATPSAMPALDRWHRDDDARVSLDTWPNLSAQPDAQAWLEVLSTAFQRGMTVGALRDCSV